jgi:1-acyl-sn-glycerol-3-phosphate acyltransferase
MERKVPTGRLRCLFSLTFIVAATGSLIGCSPNFDHADQENELPWLLVLFSAGAGLGSLLAGCQRHPRRQLGLVPMAATVLLLSLAWVAIGSNLAGSCLVLGLMSGLVTVPLGAAYLRAVAAGSWRRALAFLTAILYASAAIIATTLLLLGQRHIFSSTAYLWFVISLTGAGVLVAWVVLVRESVEQLIEILIWPFYQIREYGPGLQEIPRHGPLLLIANHTSWFDPAFLAKVIPRRLTPMMTSHYYDLPVVHWLMIHLVHAIRVQAGKLQREPPEIREAVAALDRGECLIIFPEGYMKRRADRPLNRFGQGIWRILRERPATPVVTCWIEGGWGSYASYAGGPPTVNKRLDWWRPILVAVPLPQVLDPNLLADQRATRTYLMRDCLEARRHLGLESFDLREAVEAESDED